MAKVQAIRTLSLPQGADLTGSIGELLKLNATGQVIKTAAATDICIGILAESAPRATVGDAVKVAIIGGGGILKCKTNAAVAAGNLLVPAASGKAAPVADIAALATNQMAFGVAVSATAADGEIVSFLAMAIGPKS